MATVGAPKFVDAERARHRDWTNREIGGTSGRHPHHHAVVECRPGAEAAFLIVTDEHKLRQPRLLEARKDVSTEPHALPVEGGDPRREPIAVKRLVLLKVECKIVEGDVGGPTRGGGTGGDRRRCDILLPRVGRRSAAGEGDEGDRRQHVPATTSGGVSE